MSCFEENKGEKIASFMSSILSGRRIQKCILLESILYLGLTKCRDCIFIVVSCVFLFIFGLTTMTAYIFEILIKNKAFS